MSFVSKRQRFFFEGEKGFSVVFEIFSVFSRKNKGNWRKEKKLFFQKKRIFWKQQKNYTKKNLKNFKNENDFIVIVYLFNASIKF